MPGDKIWQNVHIVLFENVGRVTRESILKFATEMDAVLVAREVGDEGRPHYHLAIMLKEKMRDKPLRDLIKGTFAVPGIAYKRNELYNIHDWNRKPDDYYLEEYLCKGTSTRGGTVLPDIVMGEVDCEKFHKAYWTKEALKAAVSAKLAKQKASDKSEKAQKVIADALKFFDSDVHPRTPMDVLYFVIDELKGSQDDRAHALIAQRILFILDKQTTRVSMATRIFNRFFC